MSIYYTKVTLMREECLGDDLFDGIFTVLYRVVVA